MDFNAVIIQILEKMGYTIIKWNWSSQIMKQKWFSATGEPMISCNFRQSGKLSGPIFNIVYDGSKYKLYPGFGYNYKGNQAIIDTTSKFSIINSIEKYTSNLIYEPEERRRCYNKEYQFSINGISKL